MECVCRLGNQRAVGERQGRVRCRRVLQIEVDAVRVARGGLPQSRLYLKGSRMQVLGECVLGGSMSGALGECQGRAGKHSNVGV